MKCFIQQFVLCLFLISLAFVTTAPAQSKMYWTEHFSDPKIRRADLDGSNIEDILTNSTSGFTSAFDLVIDDIAGKIYWTNEISDKIQRADLDGNNLEDILTGLTNPLNITLDASGGKIYWSDYDYNSFNGRIRRANLDGSNVEDLVDLGNPVPNGLALDISGGKMYWITSQLVESNVQI
jgi:DNA-binding beta-propeller fold protein YncE